MSPWRAISWSTSSIRRPFAANLSAILVPDGIVAVAVPHFGSLLSRLQGKKDMFICPPEHLNFFSRRGLDSALRTQRLPGRRPGDGLEAESDEDPQGGPRGLSRRLGLERRLSGDADHRPSPTWARS